MKGTKWTLLPILAFLFIFSLCGQATALNGIEYEYQQAQSCSEELLKDPKNQNDRHHWLLCINQFRSVYTAKPDGPRADDALLMMGRLYSKLYVVSSSLKDRQETLDYYARLVKRFPKSPYRPEAERAIATLQTDKEKRAMAKGSVQNAVPIKKGVTKGRPLPPVKESNPGKERLAGGAKPFAEVGSLRYWSNPNYTRVVINVAKEVPYMYRLLKKDPAIGKPQRLYVDIENARMGANTKPVVPIGDDLLSHARAAQHTADTVRIVLDIKSIDTFKIFSLQNPFRIVLDVNGYPRKTSSKIPYKQALEKPAEKIPKGALAKQLALGVSRIVIDPGHGGRDPGAPGYAKSVLEKNVTLEVARRLARKVRQKLGCEAILTRNGDTLMSLEERTAIANTKNADIFISIHTNANKVKSCRGIETYFLNLATDEDAILVAARENATSAKNISDLEGILNELMNNAKVDESSRLASHVQQALVRKLKPRYKRIEDKGVKQAPFYVLLGAEMPCILIELAFITNPVECRRLNSARYQDDMADGIVQGIRDYIKEISPASLTRAEKGEFSG